MKPKTFFAGSTTPSTSSNPGDRSLAAERGASQLGLRTWLVIAFVLLCIVSLKVRQLQTARIIRDEFEHMHAIWLVYNGQMPYVDFFEHHTPLFYFVGPLIFPLRNPSFHTLILARYVGLLVQILLALIAWGWVRRQFGTAAAAVVAALFCTNVFLFVYGGFTYLDTYAAPLLLASAVLLGGKRTGWRIGLSGLAFGISVLLAIKAAMAAFAYLAYFLARAFIELRDREGRKTWLMHVACFTVGGVLSCVPLVFLLGTAGLQGFWLNTVVLNSRWKARYLPYDATRLLVTTDLLVYAAAIAFAFFGFWKLAKRGWKVNDSDIAMFFFLSLCAGVFLIPVVWEEYYLLLLPFALILAGLGLTTFARTYLMGEGGFLPSVRDRNWWGFLAVVGAAVLLAFPVLIQVGQVSRLGALRLAGITAAWLVLLVVLTRNRSLSPRLKAALWIALISVYPLHQQLYFLFRRPKNDDQRARVDYVMENTRPTDAVFDGNSGYGVFRPHAFKYWLLHDEVQAMLTPAEKGPGLIEALEERKPPIAIIDRFTLMLPQGVIDYLNTHYEPTPYTEIRKRRRDR